ncbi:MAG: glycosyltransferase [Paracoccus sp. (in: a-proteobacteria)]|uniref:glycosyltransferase family 2 protein n=1 Tax=Paracoccus sp. TaxID=267 RepID=UPI0026DFFF2D|nr:glycosyltransferase [Paracoccus sp. (in: a-proteobacteria)]MDO5621737.1 glycosyltransferase [Paracoccus sp. (in: a-proteobacteria)]
MRVSVVVTSRHRPDSLALCLHALSLQTHPAFEVILIADPGSILTRPDLPLRRVVFDVPNISRARNIGIARAAGDVVAFIDDDAVAEPSWLARLTAPFADARVDAATGFTRGPDGIGWQVRAERISRDGRAATLPAPQETQLFPALEQISTIGTNCAFRRAALVQVGGFDPDFAFHLDESDVNMRLAAVRPDGLTAVVPGAEVTHGLAASARRDRVPTDLYDIGRSHAIFARKHGGGDDWVAAAQRKRLIRAMLSGALDPFGIAPLLKRLDQGRRAGAVTAIKPPMRQFPPAPDFRPMPRRQHDHHLLSGWQWQAQALRAQAAALVAQGNVVTLILFSPSFLPARSMLTQGGWWEWRGGLWGADGPGEPPLRLTRKAAQAARIARHISAVRGG